MTQRLRGRFTIKDRQGDGCFLMYEAGPGPLVTIEIPSSTPRSKLEDAVRALNVVAGEVIVYGQ
jgi:hypothetical protein